MSEWSLADVHVCTELAQGLVEIIHLCHDGDHSDDHKGICARVDQLILAAECEFESNTEPLDRTNGDASDSTADAEVDQRVLLAVFGGHIVDHEDGKGDHDRAVEQEARLDGII